MSNESLMFEWPEGSGKLWDAFGKTDIYVCEAHYSRENAEYEIEQDEPYLVSHQFDSAYDFMDGVESFFMAKLEAQGWQRPAEQETKNDD